MRSESEKIKTSKLIAQVSSHHDAFLEKLAAKVGTVTRDGSVIPLATVASLPPTIKLKHRLPQSNSMPLIESNPGAVAEADPSGNLASASKKSTQHVADDRTRAPTNAPVLQSKPGRPYISPRYLVLQKIKPLSRKRARYKKANSMGTLAVDAVVDFSPNEDAKNGDGVEVCVLETGHVVDLVDSDPGVSRLNKDAQQPSQGGVGRKGTDLAVQGTSGVLDVQPKKTKQHGKPSPAPNGSTEALNGSDACDLAAQSTSETGSLITMQQLDPELEAGFGDGDPDLDDSFEMGSPYRDSSPEAGLGSRVSSHPVILAADPVSERLLDLDLQPDSSAHDADVSGSALDAVDSGDREDMSLGASSADTNGLYTGSKTRTDASASQDNNGDSDHSDASTRLIGTLDVASMETLVNGSSDDLLKPSPDESRTGQAEERRMQEDKQPASDLPVDLDTLARGDGPGEGLVAVQSASANPVKIKQLLSNKKRDEVSAGLPSVSSSPILTTTQVSDRFNKKRGFIQPTLKEISLVQQIQVIKTWDALIMRGIADTVSTILLDRTSASGTRKSTPVVAPPKHLEDASSSRMAAHYSWADILDQSGPAPVAPFQLSEYDLVTTDCFSVRFPALTHRSLDQSSCERTNQTLAAAAAKLLQTTQEPQGPGLGSLPRSHSSAKPSYFGPYSPHLGGAAAAQASILRSGENWKPPFGPLVPPSSMHYPYMRNLPPSIPASKASIALGIQKLRCEQQRHSEEETLRKLQLYRFQLQQLKQLQKMQQLQKAREGASQMQDAQQLSKIYASIGLTGPALDQPQNTSISNEIENLEEKYVVEMQRQEIQRRKQQQDTRIQLRGLQLQHETPSSAHRRDGAPLYQDLQQLQQHFSSPELSRMPHAESLHRRSKPRMATYTISAPSLGLGSGGDSPSHSGPMRTHDGDHRRLLPPIELSAQSPHRQASPPSIPGSTAAQGWSASDSPLDDSPGYSHLAASKKILNLEVKLGGLGPDRESDEYVAKLEKWNRQKQYAASVRALAMSQLRKNMIKQHQPFHPTMIEQTHPAHGSPNGSIELVTQGNQSVAEALDEAGEPGPGVGPKPAIGSATPKKPHPMYVGKHPSVDEIEGAAQRREKMLQYASTIKKPAMSINSSTATLVANDTSRSDSRPSPKSLEALEQEHLNDMQSAESIRRQLNL